MANTFVIPREMEHLHAIERLTKRKIARRKAPSLGEVLEGQQKLAVQSLINMADDTENLKEYRASAEELLNDLDSVTLVAAAIKLLTKEPDTTPVNITEEAPYGFVKNALSVKTAVVVMVNAALAVPTVAVIAAMVNAVSVTAVVVMIPVVPAAIVPNAAIRKAKAVAVVRKHIRAVPLNRTSKTNPTIYN